MASPTSLQLLVPQSTEQFKEAVTCQQIQVYSYSYTVMCRETAIFVYRPLRMLAPPSPI